MAPGDGYATSCETRSSVRPRRFSGQGGGRWLRPNRMVPLEQAGGAFLPAGCYNLRRTETGLTGRGNREHDAYLSDRLLNVRRPSARSGRCLALAGGTQTISANDLLTAATKPESDASAGSTERLA